MFSGNPFGDIPNINIFAAAAANLAPNPALPAAPAPPSQLQTTELSAIAADQLGLTTADASNATMETAAAAMASLYKELEEIPLNEKAAYVYAQQTKPELVRDEEVFKFLLAENFKAKEAARRIISYWNERYRLFGQDKFILPLTLKGAMKDDSLALSRGYVQLLPQPDTAGRALIYVDWSCHEPSIGYSVDSMHRVFWYIVHAAMEDTEALKKGMVVLIYPQEARLDQFDHNLWKSISESCKYSLPVHWRSTHIVHPNRFFSIIHPLFMSTLPQAVQDRVIVHSGTKMKVLANLLRYCLPWDRIPSDVGGCVDLDLGVWLSERMVKEDQRTGTTGESSQGGIENLLAQMQGKPDQDQTKSMQTGPTAPGSESMATLPRPDQSTSETSNPSFSGTTSQLLLNLPQSTGNKNTSDTAQKPADPTPAAASSSKKPTKKKEKTPAAKAKPPLAKSGRKSDPRMDRAVEAKLADPSMSLIDALRAGGFDIPNSGNASTPQYVVVDGDNVKITQRKNQLLRRLRTAKASSTS